MRRFIAAFLLLFIPLQASFAAAASYCNLETADTPTHFGHHEHVDSLPTPEPDEPKKLDSECGVCHLGCVQAQLSMSQELPTFTAQPTRSGADDPEPDHLSEANERPPRLLLA